MNIFILVAIILIYVVPMITLFIVRFIRIRKKGLMAEELPVLLLVLLMWL